MEVVMARKRTKEFYSEIDQIADSEAFLESIHKGFYDVEDPRVQDNQSYSLVSLLVMILCAILAEGIRPRYLRLCSSEAENVSTNFTNKGGPKL